MPGHPWRTILWQAVLILAVSLMMALAANAWRAQPLSLLGNGARSPAHGGRDGETLFITLDEAADHFWGQSAVFVDARPERFYREGHIAGARSLPLEQVAERVGDTLGDVAPETCIITYCDGETCTLGEDVALFLREMGFDSVRVLADGWSLWREHQLPVENEEAA